ncbi:MAG: hypothetical protein M1833_006832 [Piccolia ochrophora]|nr:MAG: hypothetical protein M1833_006832 [Piccolia ochrophora]
MDAILNHASATLVVAGLVLYVVGGAIYRLYFSPLAGFPGPKIVALTFWYELYWEIIKVGRYQWKIKEMHEKYGPIVRISPIEIHINDPEFIDTVYPSSGRRTDKHIFTARAFGNSDSFFGTLPHDAHRLRRAPLNPFFSVRMISSVEHIICERAIKLESVVAGYKGKGQPLNFTHASVAYAGDVVSAYAFAQSYDMLESPKLGADWYEIFEGFGRMTHIFPQFGWVYPLMKSLPDALVMKLNPLMSTVLKVQNSWGDQIRQIKDGENEKHKDASHPTIFRELLQSNMPPSEKTTERLQEEAQSVVGAGMVTTANQFGVAVFHLLSNPTILERLREELREPMADFPWKMPTWTELQRLPYFSSILLETFRISSGIPHRLPRISPDIPIRYKDWVIPPGTPVGMSSLLIHDNPDLFPEPRTFKPERWLDGGRKRLEKYLLTFSRGTRQCLGMNLATAELYLGLASIFRPDGPCMELFETDRSDIDAQHDLFNPHPKLGTKGIQVLVT